MLILTVSYKLKDGKRDEFIERLLNEKIAEQTQAEDGCIRYEYFMPVGKEDELFLLEVWENREKQQAHLQSGHMKTMQQFKGDYVQRTELSQL